MSPAPGQLPFKISVLLFLKDSQGRFLLIRRRKVPNLGCWSPPGGKLEQQLGESPFECAIREAKEETGADLAPSDLHLFGMISERGYEGAGHWLMFLFDCRKPIDSLPPEIDEGHFGHFSREEIETIAIPESDRTLIWPVYDEFKDGFVAYRAECHPDKPLRMLIEQTLRGNADCGARNAE